MTWILPPPLLLVAASAALLPLSRLLRRPASPLRLVAETFATTFAIIAVVWLVWVALWLLEQRW